MSSFDFVLLENNVERARQRTVVTRWELILLDLVVMTMDLAQQTRKVSRIMLAQLSTRGKGLLRFGRLTAEEPEHSFH
jgi:hypothetical protein